MPNRVSLALVLVAGMPLSHVFGQADVKTTVPGGDAPSWVIAQIPDPSDPRVQEHAKRQKRRVELERELFKLRAEFFRNIRNTEIRQIGITKLRNYTQPVLYPSLLKIFKNEGMDVRGAVLDILADQANDEADTVLTWAAVFDEHAEFRAAAAERLSRRLAESKGGATPRIKSVIAEGLRAGTNDEMSAAAKLAGVLDLVEAIPMLISAQLGGGAAVGGGGNQGNTSLAWILVGTQQAFVSDLTPVVGDSAVAFDPQVSVVTEGTYLRVIDAHVVTYRMDVHSALVGLSSKAWGKSTKEFGFDQPRWRSWYTDEFKPFWAAKQAEAAAAKGK